MTDYAQQLVGGWQLCSWELDYADTGVTRYPYGQQARGLLLYTADGWMNAVIERGGRSQVPAGVNPRAIEPDLLATAYREFFQYAGHYRIEGDAVVHTGIDLFTHDGCSTRNDADCIRQINRNDLQIGRQQAPRFEHLEVQLTAL